MTPLAGVLGFPVAHSRSPQMMNAAFEALGLDWRYVKLPVRPELFEDTARALPGSGYRGANVTIPHKVAALKLADEHGEEARAIGAANTLTFADGSIRADNTDAGGLLDAMGVDPAGRSALVLGAGGAARAAVWALRGAGAAVSVWNRNADRAKRLADDFGVEPASRPRSVDVLVNATSVGLAGESEQDMVDALHLEGVEAPKVVDLVYGEGEPAVSAWALRRGFAVVPGTEVLVRQGARSLELWTGKKPPLDAMRRGACGEGV
ncbi:MAG TPA: shikimate dehydrogenase [Thermoleophilaceae bacterium]|nr:shikimate dehydrogenase [Thermoleophilaceae bacterium]